MKTKNYFLMGLFVFAFLISEILVVAVEYLIFDLPRGVEFSLAIPVWYRAIIHWCMTISVWTLGFIYFYRWSKKNNVLQELFTLKLDKTTALLSILAILICLGINYLVDIKIENSGTFPQILGEFRYFEKKHGDKAVFMSIFQNIYYISETLLVIWIVAFMQKAGELLTNKKFIWGAVGVTLTWGIGHFFSHPIGAIFVTFGAFIYGIFYLVSKKNFYPVFLFIWLAFVL